MTRSVYGGNIQFSLTDNIEAPTPFSQDPSRHLLGLRLKRMVGGGRGGRCLSGGGGGVQPPPSPAKMNHIHQELQKCTPLTHSAYTFVIMSEDR